MVKDLDNEVWKVHPKWNWMAASNLGRIKSLERDIYKKDGSFFRHQQEQLIKPYPISSGYLQFNIRKNGKRVATPYAHRFVYECLNQVIILDDLEINHKSEIKTENFIENLELLDHQSNIDYSQSKQVGQYTLDGELIKIWKSTMEAERNGYSSGNISKCCNGKSKTHKHFIWKYI